MMHILSIGIIICGIYCGVCLKMETLPRVMIKNESKKYICTIYIIVTQKSFF